MLHGRGAGARAKLTSRPQHKISLCLIVWNELQGCRIDVPKLPRHGWRGLFAVDGGTDRTVEYLEQQRIPVHRQPKSGLNAAYVRQRGRDREVVAFFPKGNLPTGDLLKFRQLFEAGNQLVVASRQVAGSVNEEDTSLLRPRKWAVRVLAMFAALLWRREGHFVRDVLHGFKGWTKSAFSLMKVLDYGSSVDIEMVVRAYKLKLRRAEFPTIELARGYGETRFKMWPTGKQLLGYLWFEWRRHD